MQNIKIHRYAHPRRHGFSAAIEPADKSWIAFVGLDGRPLVFPHRDASGAILSGDPDEDRATLAHRARQREEGRGGLYIGMPYDGSDERGGLPPALEIGEPVFPLGTDGTGGVGINPLAP